MSCWCHRDGRPGRSGHRSGDDGRWRLLGGAVARDRTRVGPRHVGPERVDLCALERAHRPARQPRRRRSVRDAGHLPQLSVRAASAALRGGRLRQPGVGADSHQRHRRQADPAARRRRTVRRALRHARRTRAYARSPGRDAQPSCPVDLAGPGQGADLVSAARFAHPSGRGGDLLRDRTDRHAAAHRRAVRARGQRSTPGPGSRPSDRRGAGEPARHRGADGRQPRRADGAPDPSQWAARRVGHGARHRRPRRDDSSTCRVLPMGAG